MACIFFLSSQSKRTEFNEAHFIWCCVVSHSFYIDIQGKISLPIYDSSRSMPLFTSILLRPHTLTIDRLLAKHRRLHARDHQAFSRTHSATAICAFLISNFGHLFIFTRLWLACVCAWLKWGICVYSHRCVTAFPTTKFNAHIPIWYVVCFVCCEANSRHIPSHLTESKLPSVVISIFNVG